MGHAYGMSAENKPPAEVDTDQLRQQWDQVIESTRVMVSLLLQAWGFLAAAYTTLLAFALSKEDRYWALIPATIMPLL